MNKRSLQNLTGKQKAGYLSNVSAQKFKNTILNFLYARHDFLEEKKETSQNTVLLPTHRQKPTHKSPTAAGMQEYNRSAKSEEESIKTQNILRGVYFVTFTTNLDCSTVENEMRYSNAIRLFLKNATEYHNITYFSKCEKDSEKHMHYHCIIMCDENAISLLASEYMTACQKFQIDENSKSVYIQELEDSEESFAKISNYISKQTLFPVMNRIISMSNVMQKFAPFYSYDRNTLNEIQEKAEKIVSVTKSENVSAFERYAVYAICNREIFLHQYRKVFCIDVEKSAENH